MDQDDQNAVRDGFSDLLGVLCQPLTRFLEDLEHEKSGKIREEKNLHGRAIKCLKSVKTYMSQALHVVNPRLADLVQLERGVLCARGFKDAVKTFKCFERILQSRGLHVHMRFTYAEMRQIQIYAALSGPIKDVEMVRLGDERYVSCPNCHGTFRIIDKS